MSSTMPAAIIGSSSSDNKMSTWPSKRPSWPQYWVVLSQHEGMTTVICYPECWCFNGESDQRSRTFLRIKLQMMSMGITRPQDQSNYGRPSVAAFGTIELEMLKVQKLIKPKEANVSITTISAHEGHHQFLHGFRPDLKIWLILTKNWMKFCSTGTETWRNQERTQEVTKQREKVPARWFPLGSGPCKWMGKDNGEGSRAYFSYFLWLTEEAQAKTGW